MPRKFTRYYRQTTASLSANDWMKPRKTCDDEGYYTSWCQDCRDYTEWDDGTCLKCDLEQYQR
jgi:hypothetical protein